MSSELFPSCRKYPLLSLPSQLFPLKEKIGGRQVFMWRDDPDDFGFGGNKVRFYEYLIPEIIDAAPDVIISSGSRYSNHVRVTALVAARLGIPAMLLINEDEAEDKKLPAGNLTLAAATGAEIRFIGHFAALLKINEYADELRRQGKKVFVVPSGGHTDGAVRAYANVFAEAMTRLSGYGVKIDRIFLPCASGTTHAGLLCGAEITYGKIGYGLPRISSFAVANTVRGAVKGITKLNFKAVERFPDVLTGDPGVADVLDCGKNEYGIPDGELLSLREDITRTEGVTLDSVYNINAFYGMKKVLESEDRASDAAVLYINTGGYVK